MRNGSPPGEQRRLVLRCAALNMEVAFTLRPGEFARIGASPEIEITLPLTGLRDEECQLSCDDGGTLWLTPSGGARVRSPDGFEAGPYFFDIVQVPAKAAAEGVAPVGLSVVAHAAQTPGMVFPRPRTAAPVTEVSAIEEEPAMPRRRLTLPRGISWAVCAALIVSMTVWLVLREQPADQTRNGMVSGAGISGNSTAPNANAGVSPVPVANTSTTASTAPVPVKPQLPPVPQRRKAGAEFRAKADAGDALSQAQLADALPYDSPDDAALVEAADWAKKSSAQGCALGTQILAALMKEGDGCAWDPDGGETLSGKNEEALIAGADTGPPAWKRWVFESPPRRTESYNYSSSKKGTAERQHRERCLLLAADAGDAMAIITRAEQNTFDDAALTKLRKLADAGDARAMRLLGRLCVEGVRMQPSFTAGIVWYEKAAEAGCHECLVDMALVYSSTAAVQDQTAKDPAKYSAMLERALVKADSRLAAAVFVRLETGDGLPRDSAAAGRWLAKAALERQAQAIAKVIAHLQHGPDKDDLLYRVGNDCYDPARAEEWFARLSALKEKPPGVPLWLFSAALGTPKEESGDYLKWMLRAVEAGSVKAMYWLADGYSGGYRLPKDEAKAREWYRKAAHTGNLEAQYQCAHFLSREGEKAEAVQWYRKAAEAGYSRAMIDLAELLATGGGGVIKNDAEATEWYRKCAQGGSVPCTAILCWRLEKKAGVEAVLGEAADWRRKMDDNRRDMDQSERGRLLKSVSECFKKEPHTDPAESRAWLKKSAGEGENQAIKELAKIPKSGTPDEIAEAVKYMEMLAEEGDRTTMFLLAYRYKTGEDGVRIDKKRALHWTAKLAEKGDYGATRSMGWFYLNGEGVPKNDAEAFNWFRKAVEAGVYDYASMLGDFCHEGQGVPKNATEAARWYERGALMDETDCMINAGAVWINGSGVRKDPVRAYARANVAAARGADDADKSIVKKAEANRRISERLMTRAQNAEAQKLSKELVAQIEVNYANLLDRIKNNKPHPLPESLDPPVLAVAPRARPVTPPAKSPGPVSPGAAFATGTAWAVSDRGHLLTCAHVVAGAVAVKVHLPSGRTVNATVLRTDKTNDIAVLKIEIVTAPLPLAAGPAEVGQTVATLGFPNTTLQGREVKLTDGIVSSLSGLRGDRGKMQISVPIQPGNSGGPLLDLHGAVIGIVTARLSDKAAIMESGAVPQAVNYATKISLAHPLLTEFALKSAPPNRATESPPNCTD